MYMGSYFIKPEIVVNVNNVQNEDREIHHNCFKKEYEGKKKQQGITVITVDDNNNICTDNAHVDCESERVPYESDIVGVHRDIILSDSEDVPDSDSSGDCGRRIVELGVIVKNLLKGCYVWLPNVTR